MLLTFMFVERNAVTIAVKLKKMCVNVNKGRGYVVVYRSKKEAIAQRILRRHNHVLCSYYHTFLKFVQQPFQRCKSRTQR